MASCRVSQALVLEKCHRLIPKRRQLRPRRHNLAPVNAKIEDTQGEAARAPPVPSPPVPPPGLSVPPRPLSSYDDMDGYEAGAMPPHGEASGEGAAAAVEEERRRQGASCLLVEDQANRAEYEAQLQGMGEWPQSDQAMPPGERVLESVDGMVGNYEFAVGEKRRELQEAADDYERILAELSKLEAAAGMGNRAAAVGGAATSAEVGEGAGVEDLE